MNQFLRIRFRTSPLRDRFLFFFSIAACIPVLMLGIASLLVIDRAHRSDVSKLALQFIEEKEAEIQRFFTDTLGLLQIRLDPELLESSSGWEHDIAPSILAEHDAFEEVSIIDLQGKEVVRASKEGTARDLLYMTELPAFKTALAGKTFIGEVHRSFAGPSLTLAAPILVENRVARIMMAEVSVRDLLRSLNASRLGATGYLLIVDQNGTLLNSKKMGINMGSVDRVRRALAGERLNGLEARDRYESIIGSGGVIGAAALVSEVGWALLAEWPLEDADALIAEIRSHILLVAVVSILLVALIVPLLIGRLLKPIRALEQGARSIEEGDFTKSVEIKTRDELQDLGSAFNKMARGLKRLQELKNEFVFIAAHELRSPVTAIKGFLSLIDEGEGGAVSKRMKSLLDPVSQANERLVQLVNDLLEIARSEAGKLQVALVPCNIEDAINAILTEARVLAEEKSVTVTYEKNSNGPQAMADPMRLKEVMMNFISNAIKYNRVGGAVRIWHEVEGGTLVTHVEDTGIGMSREQQTHIFEKFYRAESEEVRSITGTGLGMFITKELIEKMGGAVWFTSEKGRGSRFSFRLPIAPKT